MCASGPTCVFRRGPGRPNTRVSTRRGWIKAAASCLLSSPSSSSSRVQLSRPHTRVRPRMYAGFDGIECYWNFFSCSPPRNKQFAQISREIIVAGLFPIPRRKGRKELGNCRGSYCSLFVNFYSRFLFCFLAS